MEFKEALSIATGFSKHSFDVFKESKKYFIFSNKGTLSAPVAVNKNTGEVMVVAPTAPCFKDCLNSVEI